LARFPAQSAATHWSRVVSPFAPMKTYAEQLRFRHEQTLPNGQSRSAAQVPTEWKQSTS
jgi:hypothetical protein